MSNYLTGAVLVKCSYDLLNDGAIDTDALAKIVAADVEETFTKLLKSKPDLEGSPGYTLESNVFKEPFEGRPSFTFKVEVPVDPNELDNERYTKQYVNQARNTTKLMVRCVRAGLGYAEPFPGL